MRPVGDVEILGRTEEVREREARQPLAEAGGVVTDEARERGHDRAAAVLEHRVLALERDEREEDLGLVPRDERERAVIRERLRGRGHDGGDRVGERLVELGGGDDGVAQRPYLAADERDQQLLLVGETA